MNDLVVVSNRGPRSFALDDLGRPVDAGTAGGLAATLHSVLAGTGATWIAASMNEADRQASAAGLMDENGLRCVTVDPEPEQYRMAYDVVSNATLWFCHHHLFDLARRPRLDRRWHRAWDAYRELNALFAAAVSAEAAPGAAVLVHDYHLALMGAMLAGDRPDLRTVHFSHTPFADPEMLRALPDGALGELLAGMAGFGSCGFHTGRWERAFRDAYADPALAALAGTSTAPPTFVSPLGVDHAALEAEAGSPTVEAARRDLAPLVGDRKLIVRVDRVELSKNVLRGFWSYEELLDTRPEWRGRVVMLALVYPSRQGIAEYLAYRSEIEHTVARINGTWGTSDWTPVVLDVGDDRSRSLAALSLSDVLLVNPVRDGLNLVAKEGPLVNRFDGVLVLSREAGAWEELHPGAVGINPFDVTGTADALELALAMSPEERSSRASVLRRIGRARTAADWLADLLGASNAITRAGATGAGG
jgi:trehalose 6-phosphate synthase